VVRLRFVGCWAGAGEVSAPSVVVGLDLRSNLPSWLLKIIVGGSSGGLSEGLPGGLPAGLLVGTSEESEAEAEAALFIERVRGMLVCQLVRNGMCSGADLNYIHVEYDVWLPCKSQLEIRYHVISRSRSFLFRTSSSQTSTSFLLASLFLIQSQSHTDNIYYITRSLFSHTIPTQRKGKE